MVLNALFNHTRSAWANVAHARDFVLLIYKVSTQGHHIGDVGVKYRHGLDVLRVVDLLRREAATYFVRRRVGSIYKESEPVPNPFWLVTDGPGSTNKSKASKLLRDMS